MPSGMGHTSQARSIQVPHMYMVERAVEKGPALSKVFDLNFDVGWHPLPLDWGHVGAHYFSFGELVAKVQSLDTRTCLKVQRLGYSRIFQWREV